jgi:hypothetical protein
MDMNLQEALVHQYIAAYNDFNIEGMVELFTQDCIFENITNTSGNMTTKGIDEFKELALAATDLFSSRQQLVKNLYVGSDHAVAEISYTGILKIDLPSGQKTGETIALNAVSIFEFGDGKITRLVDYS